MIADSNLLLLHAGERVEDRVSQKIDALAKLGDNWDGMGAKEALPSAVTTAKEIADYALRAGITRADAFINPDGRISVCMYGDDYHLEFDCKDFSDIEVSGSDDTEDAAEDSDFDPITLSVEFAKGIIDTLARKIWETRNLFDSFTFNTMTGIYEGSDPSASRVRALMVGSPSYTRNVQLGHRGVYATTGRDSTSPHRPILQFSSASCL